MAPGGERLTRRAEENTLASVKWTFVGFALAVALAGCSSSPPIKNAAGDRIDGVSVVEAFPLSDKVYDMSFHGARLRRAVELMDKHGVFAAAGNHSAGTVMNKSTLTLTVKGADGSEKKVVAKNCGETHLCAFFEEASKEGIVEKLPAICRDPLPCTRE